MNDKPAAQDTFRTLQLMNELETGEQLSQRELAGRLGIAVGLVNSYLKNFVAKGFVRVKNYPRNRYAYLLTPKGITEKSRLALQHLSYFNSLYGTVRQDYLRLFVGLQQQGATAVTFCGVDDVTEIAYLSLQEVGIGLAGVVDVEETARDFFGLAVQPLESWVPVVKQPVVLTSLKRADELRHCLVEKGLAAEEICAPNC
jgi:DNA-binding MarR family transcriptional regulator